MKKIVTMMALTCTMTLQGNAQVYQYDTWSQLPVQDIYGDMLNPSMARMMAEADARMEEAFNFYYDKARDACGQKNWSYTIYYADKALDTGYYNSDVFYLKGCAYEGLGNLRKAKSQYRKAKRKGSNLAKWALERLKKEAKERRKK